MQGEADCRNTLNLAVLICSKLFRMQAYSILSDPAQRQQYNARLQEQLQDAIDDYTGQALHFQHGNATDSICTDAPADSASCKYGCVPEAIGMLRREAAQ